MINFIRVLFKRMMDMILMRLVLNHFMRFCAAK